jgi:hypothetical protein
MPQFRVLSTRALRWWHREWDIAAPGDAALALLGRLSGQPTQPGDHLRCRRPRVCRDDDTGTNHDATTSASRRLGRPRMRTLPVPFTVPPVTRTPTVCSTGMYSLLAADHGLVDRAPTFYHNTISRNLLHQIPFRIRLIIWRMPLTIGVNFRMSAIWVSKPWTCFAISAITKSQTQSEMHLLVLNLAVSPNTPEYTYPM